MHIFSFCIILVIWCWGGVVGLHSMRLSYLSLYRPFQIECNVSNPNVVMSSSSGGNLLFDGSWNNSQFPSLSYSGWLDWIVAGRFDSVQRLSRSNPKKRLLTRFLNLKTVKQSQYQIAGTQHDSLKFPIWINSRSPSSTPHWFSCNFSQQTQQKVLLMGLFHFISKLIQHILRYFHWVNWIIFTQFAPRCSDLHPIEINLPMRFNNARGNKKDMKFLLFPKYTNFARAG